MRRTLFRTRIKFCGMTRAGDVRLASELGVDAIGFVFAGDGPRRVHAQQARLMRNALAPLVDVVALFMDNAVEEVREVVKLVRPTLLQFHGSEGDSFCRGFGVPYLKAIPMGGWRTPGTSELRRMFPAAAGFVFDSHAEGTPGGSGQAFDWTRLPPDLDKPMLLAGGLEAGNVFEAITTALPWGVDVSSGVESSPGIKDGERMRRFVEEVRRADCHVEHDAP
ncbi:MAG: phosphoribosylanthranilate isomerase [Pseudomonadota bacterium]|nr:phosphoribosylanthranilate isomerase [Pseudomonadota bacterium]